jgi:hypothetical protein
VLLGEGVGAVLPAGLIGFGLSQARVVKLHGSVLQSCVRFSDSTKKRYHKQAQ